MCLFQAFNIHWYVAMDLILKSNLILKKLKTLKTANIHGNNWHARKSPGYVVNSTKWLFVKGRFKFKSRGFKLQNS